MNIYQVAAIFWARRSIILTVVVGVLIAAAVALIFMPKRYEATAQLMLNVDMPDIVLNTTISPNGMRDAVYQHMETLRTRGDAIEAVKILGLEQKPEFRAAFEEATGGKGDFRNWAADALLSQIVVKRVGATQIVSVTGRASEPQLAADIANAFVQAHRNKDIEMRIEPAAETLRWFDSQIATLQGSLSKAQDQRIEERRSTQSGDGPRVVATNTADFGRDLAASQIELAQAKAALDQARDSKSSAPITDETNAIDKQIRDLDQAIIQETEALGPQHRRIRLLKSNREGLQGALAKAQEAAKSKAAAEAEQRVSTARLRLDSITSSVDSALTQNDRQSGIATLDRQVETIQAQLTTLLQRREVMRLNSQVDSTPIAQLTQALPPSNASSPQVGLTLSVASALGVALAFVSALIIEMLDRRIRTPDDIGSYLDSPLLGVVPRARPMRRWPKIAQIMPAALSLPSRPVPHGSPRAV